MAMSIIPFYGCRNLGCSAEHERLAADFAVDSLSLYHCYEAPLMRSVDPV